MHSGDLRLVGVDTDQDTVVIKVPLQQRKKTLTMTIPRRNLSMNMGCFMKEWVVGASEDYSEEGLQDSNLRIDSKEKEKVEVDVVSSQLKAQLRDVVFDCVEDGMVNFNYVYS